MFIFLLIVPGGSHHTIAAEHDRLPPSISAASKDKRGNLSEFFLFLKRNYESKFFLEQENERKLARLNQTRINCMIDGTVNLSRKYFF